jgi:hypothetical protein
MKKNTKIENQLLEMIQPRIQLIENKFSNVQFRVGESHALIPQVLKEIDANNQKLEFILVDGDHTTKAVQRDLKAILNYSHKHPVTIILHD